MLFTLLLLAGLSPAVISAQIRDRLPINTERSMLVSELRFGQIEDQAVADSFVYLKKPGRAFLLSAVLPGAGQYYAGAKWRAAAFLGVEALGWLLWNSYDSKGNRLEKGYIRFADQYWDLARWFEATMYYDENSLAGSHHIWVSYNPGNGELQEYAVDDSLIIKLPGIVNLAGLITLAQNGQLVPIRTRDYYENIGKYDQFSGGWYDFETYHPFDSPIDTVSVTPLRDNYLTRRLRSNEALKMATNFATIIMFNHLISAFEAVIAAKRYQPKETDVSWNMALISDFRERQPIRGLRLSVAF